jgi:DNA sulfur modification protein DndD
MVVFTQIKVENFKRFKGEHTLPLTGNGPITVIAAENGVGKTTILDAFYLALHGEKGMKQRKQDPAFSFNSWLKNAYSSTADWDGGFGKIGVRLEMTTNEGEVAIDRQFWLEESTEEITEETHLYIDGQLLRLETGEQRLQTIRSWIEALFPPAITQRFLIDGEQLGTLDVKHLGQHMKEGLDDVLGQGTLHRLQYHLNSVKRKTIATLAPADERESLELLLEERDERGELMVQLKNQIEQTKVELAHLDEKRKTLRKQLEMTSDEEGSALGKFRIAFAESNSKLASARKVANEWFTSTAPFILQQANLNLQTLEYDQAVDTLRYSAIHEEVLSVLKTTLDHVRPSLEEDTKANIQAIAESELEKTHGELPKGFRFLDAELMEAFTLQHAVHIHGKGEALSNVLSNGVKILRAHEKNTKALNEASQQAGMGEIANQLEEVSGSVGRVEATIMQLRSNLASMETLQAHDDGRIDALRASTSSDSKQQRLIDFIDSLQPILRDYADRRRDQLAQPLSDAFEDGFELLSRKAKRLKHIGVNPENYHVEIGMAGFPGNWLERDLSATEKQHVGLSLLYALRRQAQTALPVVVDTPTSRMDKRHKGYSVTKFYPKLSHQVIVLATSDDLAGGLYEELKAANALGQEILLMESGDAEVELEVGSLAHFFEVGA